MSTFKRLVNDYLGISNQSKIKKTVCDHIERKLQFISNFLFKYKFEGGNSELKVIHSDIDRSFPFQCDFNKCNFSSFTARNLHRHGRSRHSSETPMKNHLYGPAITCRLCDITIQRYHLLTQRHLYQPKPQYFDYFLCDSCFTKGRIHEFSRFLYQ